MKIRTFIYFLATFTAVFFAGCTCSKRTIVLYTTKNENVETLAKLAKMYEMERHNAVEVKVESPRRANDVLRERLKHGDCPDIIAMGGNSIYTEFIREGYLAAMDGSRILDSIKPAYIKMLHSLDAEKNSKIYAIPYSANLSGILVNKTVFDEQKIKPPCTWSGLFEVIQQFNRKKITPIEFPFLDEWTALPAWNQMVANLIPKDFPEKLERGEADFSSTHAEILERYLVLLKSKPEKDFLGLSYQDAGREFALGRTAMLINGNWMIPEIMKHNPGVALDMIPFPTFDDKRKNFVTSGLDVILALPKKSAKCRNTLDFLEFLARKENAQFYIEEQFAFSAIKGADTNENAEFTINKSVTDGKVADYPDHYYPVEFGPELSLQLVQFALNYVKGVPDSTNIQISLMNIDRAYKEILSKK